LIEVLEMSVAPPPTVTLSEFLQLTYIDESPTWEYRNGDIIQKSRGSILQKQLVAVIDALESRYEAFPEL
jgi:Uma2 family endonuclease